MLNLFAKLFGSATRDILKATRVGDLEKVKKIVLADPAMINAKGSSGETPLFKAVQNGNAEVAEFLLAQGADPNAVDKTGDAPLHKATLLADEAMVKLLLTYNADVNLPGMFGRRPLHCAGSECNVPVLEALIDGGADVNGLNENGFSPLHLAVLGKAEAVEVLLAKGAHVNAGKESHSMTPLSFLVTRGHSALEFQKVYEILQQHGAT